MFARPKVRRRLIPPDFGKHPTRWGKPSPGAFLCAATIFATMLMTAAPDISPSRYDAGLPSIPVAGRRRSHKSPGTYNAGRFPKFGTSAFAQSCNWTLQTHKENKCSILVRPHEDNFQGIADWISIVAGAFIMAQVQGCKIMLDYGVDSFNSPFAVECKLDGSMGI